jgi:NAD-dependent deacetylase
VTPPIATSIQDPLFDEIVGWIAAAERIGILTGAGISTGSGVPDFRGPNGLWTLNPGAERASYVQHYVKDEEARRAGWRAALDRRMARIVPNTGHYALVELERSGKLHGLATQNVDGLHVKAGNSEALVHELHGTWRFSRCFGCGDRRPVEETIERVAAGDEDPRCLLCGDLLKRDVILFGEALDEMVIGAAMVVAETCDLFLAIGTSLAVTPASNTIGRARAAGARTVIINAQPTERDQFASAILRGDISDLLPELVDRALWPTS